jgi:hypothetical protein
MAWNTFHVTCMICCGINNNLLIINMDLTNIVIDSSIMCKFEIKKKIHICMLSFLVCSKYLRLLFNNFNIFKIVEMIGNYMLEKYLIIQINICILVLRQVTCATMAKYYDILHKKTIYKEAPYDYQRFYC